MPTTEINICQFSRWLYYTYFSLSMTFQKHICHDDIPTRTIYRKQAQQIHFIIRWKPFLSSSLVFTVCCECHCYAFHGSTLHFIFPLKNCCFKTCCYNEKYDNTVKYGNNPQKINSLILISLYISFFTDNIAKLHKSLYKVKG